MMVHWMMNNPWPSFFGHLFDDFMKQGGGYFGAKKGLRPINVVWDYYASGDRSTAKLYVANQTSKARNGLIVSLEFFDLEGRRKYFKEVKDFSIEPNTSAIAMTVGRVAGLPSTYLLRATLRNADSNTVLAENVYWGSTADDDLGEAKNDEQFKTSLVQWADISALNAMPRTWRRREHGLRITAEVNSLMLFSQRIDELRYSYERLLLLSDRSVCQDQKIAYSSACRPHAPEGRISRKIPPAGRSRFSGEWMCI